MGVDRKKFDEALALKTAMEVFWEKGYIGASISELTQRMGINKPSMYATFGNKEALFIRATKLYCDAKMQGLTTVLQQNDLSLKQRLKTYMMSIVSVQCESQTAKGCYLVQCQTEVASGEIPAEAAKVLNDTLNFVQILLEQLFTEDEEAKQLNLDTEAKSSALSLAVTLRGCATMARCGYSKDELEPAIDHSLKGIGIA